MSSLLPHELCHGRSASLWPPTKDAFYSVPLAEESPFLFAFEDSTQPASQLTWTVLSQGFCDSPHLFGHSWLQDLQNFNSSEAVVLQYVNDVLLCAETEEACSRASEDFLNFLAGCSYKASRGVVVLRWWRNRTGRPLSPLQIHHKNI